MDKQTTCKTILPYTAFAAQIQTYAHTHLLAEPVGLVLQVAPVLLGSLAHSPEGIHHDATVAAPSVKMKVRFGDRLQLYNGSRTSTS